jgi:hypothetical protein
VGPIIVAALRLSNEFEAGIVLEGVLALLLTLGFTIRGTWRANGFSGGLQFRWWPVLWPIWIVAVPMLGLYAGQRSLKEHLFMLGLCGLVGSPRKRSSAASSCAISCPAGPVARSCGRPLCLARSI